MLGTLIVHGQNVFSDCQKFSWYSLDLCSDVVKSTKSESQSLGSESTGSESESMHRLSVQVL